MNGIRCTFEGRLGGEPVLRYTAQGTAFAAFSIAVTDDRRREGSPPEWVRVTAWEGLAEALAEQLHTGDLVGVEGRVKLNEYTARNGEPRASLNVTAWKCELLAKAARSARSAGVRALGAGLIDDRPVRIPRSAV
jgi:single-strand DNA-binding protein